MTGAEGHGDDWVFSTYHNDIQLAYEQLAEAVPALGPFRRPDSNDSTIFHRTMSDIQMFMSWYPPFFIDFVEEQFPSVHSGPAEGSSLRATTVRGGLMRGIHPLLDLSLKVRAGINQADEMSMLLENESLETVKGEMAAPLLSPGVSTRLVNRHSPSPRPHPFRIPSATTPPSKSSPKRANSGDQGEIAKRLRVTDSSSSNLPSLGNVLRQRPSLQATISASSIDSTLTETSMSSLGWEDSSPIPTSLTSIGSSCVEFAPLRANAKAPPSPISSPVSTFKPLPPVDASERVIFITPKNPYQAMFNKQGVLFHVQWEIERLVARRDDITWGDFQAKDFSMLAGPALDAGRVVEGLVEAVAKRKRTDAIMGEVQRCQLTGKASRILQEVDKEEASIVAQDLRGVGNDSLDWPYGGKLSYTVMVRPAKRRADYIRPGPVASKSVVSRTASRSPRGPGDLPDNPFRLSAKSCSGFPFQLSLRAPDMPGKSHRLARRFGSRRILIFTLGAIPTGERPKFGAMLRGRVLVLFGRPFRAVWADPDGKSVWACETGDEGGDVEVLRLKEPRDPIMPKFEELFEMFNDLRNKPHQAMAKWAARPQLLLSETVPVLRVQRETIAVIPDIVTEEAERSGKAATEQILTDGCGLMSETFAVRLFREVVTRHPHLQSSIHHRPSVIQLRLGGAKGLLALMSPDQAAQFAGKEVLLRDSMIKSLPADMFTDDPSLLTLDLVRCDFLRMRMALSAEPIICLVHGGVPPEIVIRMASDGLEALRDEFFPRPVEGENDDDVLARITHSAYTRGGVGLNRRKRRVKDVGMSARVAGLDNYHQKGEDGMDDEEGDTVDGVDRFDVDPVTGQPGSIAERVMRAVSAGFHPSESAYSGGKLHQLVKMLSNATIRAFKIPIELSLSSFIVPDTLGVLAPDELFISFSDSSNAPVDPVTQCAMPHLLGEVLVFRFPCKLPTDVRKMRAVWKPELAHLKDCVVLSASNACKRSPASLIAGGDYDGDTVHVIFDKVIVEPFKNAPDHYADVPKKFESDNFDKEVVKGTEFLESLQGANEEMRVTNMQNWLLGGLSGDTATSLYSDLHGNAVYKLGYAHPDTVRLARMFCHVLDGRKSGLQVKGDVRSRDVRRHGGELDWRAWKKGKESEESCPMPVTRGKHMGLFIMDRLMFAMEEKQKDIMRSFPSDVRCTRDLDLLARQWRSITAYARSLPDPLLRDKLVALQTHVTACRAIWSQIQSRRLDSSYDIEFHYKELLAGREPLTTPHKKRSVYGSPTKLRSESAEMGRERVRLIRELAVVWRDKPDASEVLAVSRGDEEVIRRLKLSCGADLRKQAGRVFLFDLDFEGLCDLKAKSTGNATVTVLNHVYESSAPKRRKE